MAFKALEILSSHFPQLAKEHVLKGLNLARWPGRFEKVSILYKGKMIKIILDGAHNPAGTQALVQTLKSEKISQVNLLFGVLKDKDFKAMIRTLVPFVKKVVVVPVPSERSEKAELISQNKAWRAEPITKPNAFSGLEYLKSISQDAIILVTGSLYLVGEIRQILQKEGFIKN